MRILLFEPSYGGHRLQYVGVLARALSEFTDQITIALGCDCPSSVEFKTHLSTLPDTVHIDTSLNPCTGPPLRAALAKFKALRRVITQVKPDHLYIPYADGLTQIAGLARVVGFNPVRPSMEVEALLMRGGFAYPKTTLRQKINRAASLAAIRWAPWSVIHHLDPIPFEAIQNRGGSLASRSRLIPEPVEPVEQLDSQIARKRLGIPGEGRYIGCFGRLDSRKGVDLLIKAFANAQLRDNDRVLLMGAMASNVHRLLDEHCGGLVRQGRIILFDRYVSNDELLLGVCAVNVVAALYPRHIGSSGIVVRAAAAGRPVLGSDFGWVGMATSRFALGWTCDVLNPTALAQTIKLSLDESDRFEFSSTARRFIAMHTLQNYVEAFTKRLRQRMGLPPTENQVSWEKLFEANN